MAILPRYKRLKRRDWKEPFSWFQWYHMVTSASVERARIAEDSTPRLSENGIQRLSE